MSTYSFPSPTAILALGLSLTSLPTLRADGGFYGDPPDSTHPWTIHDVNRPLPPVITPGSFSQPQQPGQPPSDAVVLFDGTPAALEKWSSSKGPAEPTKWVVVDGVLQCAPGAGYVQTKEEFGDCQLHIEWAAPSKPEGHSQGRGNSGVFLMGRVEIQVLDNFNNPTYADGMAGSVYGINPPMTNALRPPGEWQVYDIVFRRPVFKDGKELDPGYVTVMLNGVLVQDHTALEGGGGHRGRSKSRPFPEKGPLQLQDHGNPVRYRNIWYRPLPKRAIEGGVIGTLSEEQTTVQRTATAASLREKAAKLEGSAKMYTLLESLCYDPTAEKEALGLVDSYWTALSATAPDKLEEKKSSAKHLRDALKYMATHKYIPADHVALKGVTEMIAQQHWDEKRK